MPGGHHRHLDRQKWKLLIMRNLLARSWRFNELMKSLDGISQMELWGTAYKEQMQGE